MENLICALIASRDEADKNYILAALPEHMGFNITGIVKDETGAIIKSENLKPDILILDLQLSGINNLELIRIIRRRSPTTAIILLCNENDDEHDTSVNIIPGNTPVMNPVDSLANLAITAGISGFLLKEYDMDKLAYAARIIYMGGYYINELIIVKIFSMVSILNQFPAHSEYTGFTPLERSIITYLAQGLSDDKMAGVLNLSIGTIRNCITEIRQKTKMKSRIEIVIYSLVSGLIYPEHLWIWKEEKDNNFQNVRMTAKNHLN